MKRTSSQILLPSILFLLILLLWQTLSSKAIVAFWVLPSPLDVFKVFREQYSLLLYHLRPTLWECTSGLFLAVVLGIFTAVGMYGSRFIRQMLYPYLVISQTVPIIAIAPLIVLWFGYGISAKIFVVVLVCFFPIALGLFDGLKQVSVEQIRLLKSMGASELKIYRLLKIPAALPGFFTGLKLAATYSVMGAVIGEWLGGNAGLGIYLTRSTKSFQTAHVFAAIFTIVILSLLMFGIVALMERLLLRWHYTRVDEFEDMSPIL